MNEDNKQALDNYLKEGTLFELPRVFSYNDKIQYLSKKAIQWIATGEKGSSSMTMWNCLIGNKDFPVNHPCDPDDFSRCYKLLEAVPEWKAELHKLKTLSWPWSNLVDNWDKLTEMYEQNVQEQMYELMEILIR